MTMASTFKSATYPPAQEDVDVVDIKKSANSRKSPAEENDSMNLASTFKSASYSR
jgi:hypothetical protein